MSTIEMVFLHEKPGAAAAKLQINFEKNGPTGKKNNN